MNIKWDQIKTITGDGNYYMLQFVDKDVVAQIDKVDKDFWELKIEHKHLLLTTGNKTRKKLENEAGKLIELLRSYNP